MPDGYITGRKPQYGRDRWRRYEWLRTEGFTKSEARPLSRIVNEKDNRLQVMVKQRRRTLANFNRKAEYMGWTGGTWRYYWYREVRDFYKRNGLVTTKDSRGLDAKGAAGGKPNVFVWLRKVEKRITGKVSRRPSKFRRLREEYPSKGNVKAQKARARARKSGLSSGYDMGALKSGNITATAMRSMTRSWISDLRKSIRREPERREQFESQIRRLQHERRVY